MIKNNCIGYVSWEGTLRELFISSQNNSTYFTKDLAPPDANSKRITAFPSYSFFLKSFVHNFKIWSGQRITSPCSSFSCLSSTEHHGFFSWRISQLFLKHFNRPFLGIVSLILQSFLDILTVSSSNPSFRTYRDISGFSILLQLPNPFTLPSSVPIPDSLCTP